MEWLKKIWERVAKNWRTSIIAIIAGGVVVASWFGWIVTAKELLAVIVALEAIVLLFAKD
jgi:hypothetical protein